MQVRATVPLMPCRTMAGGNREEIRKRHAALADQQRSNRAEAQELRRGAIPQVSRTGPAKPLVFDATATRRFVLCRPRSTILRDGWRPGGQRERLAPRGPPALATPGRELPGARRGAGPVANGRSQRPALRTGVAPPTPGNAL